MLTTIPFSGFYSSLHDANCDDALRTAFSDDSGDVREELWVATAAYEKG